MTDSVLLLNFNLKTNPFVLDFSICWIVEYDIYGLVCIEKLTNKGSLANTHKETCMAEKLALIKNFFSLIVTKQSKQIYS